MINAFSFPGIKQFLQVLGRNVTKFCQKCNSNRFDLLIDHIFKRQDNLCFKCKIQAKLLQQVLFRWFHLFGINHEIIFNLYKDNSIRKVIKNVFKGMAIFGIRIPFVTGAPLSVVWNFTKKCNLKCSHCFADAHHNKKSINELNTEEAKCVIDILAANDVVTVNFCGGESLTREDVFEIMTYTKDCEILPSLSTNATLLSKNTCEKVYNSGVRSITISLDSLTAKNHDRLRQVYGAYDNAIEGIINAVEFRKFEEIIINTTLTDFNYNEIPHIYELVKKLGGTKYYVSRILPTGRGVNYIQHDVNNEIKIDVMRFMAKKLIQSIQSNDDLVVLGRGMPYYSRICRELSNGEIYPLCELITGYEPQYRSVFNGRAANLFHRLSFIFSGCATGLFYCGLDSEGMVLPCAPATHIKLGNILEKGLYDIWVNNPILNQIRQRSKVKGKCSKCSGRVYCGGCRLTAYGLTGDWLNSDLSCPY